MALSRSSRRFLIAIAIGLAIVLGVVGSGMWWINQQLAGDPGPGDPVQVEIPAGASASQIGEVLEDADVIRNALAFRFRARSEGLDANITAGVYDLETGMSVDEAIAALGEGPIANQVVRMTIPEGLTVAQTLQRLADQGPHDVAAYRAVLDATRRGGPDAPLRLPEWMPALDSFDPDIEVFEGLLFPLTYEFDEDVTAAEVLQELIDQVEIVMATPPPSAIAEAEAAGISRYEALVIASLVEREARVPGEWDEIAAVIRNRIDRGMLLQIDATLLYAAGDPAGGPSSIDTSIDSPYNTYARAELPPTPIAGARPEALRAVFSPAASDYLYYVVAPECDGSHRFATTLDEHNNNVAAYRQAGRCQ